MRIIGQPTKIKKSKRNIEKSSTMSETKTHKLNRDGAMWFLRGT